MRILFVTDRPAWPAIDGGRQRTALLLRALQRVGQVDTVLLFDPAGNDIADWPDLQRRMGCVLAVLPCHRGELGWWRFVRSLRSPLIDRLAHNFGALRVEYSPDPRVSVALASLLQREKYDVIVGRYLRPTAYSGALAYRPLVLDVDDLDTQAYQSRLQVPGLVWWKKWIIKRHLRQLAEIVPAAINPLAHLWVAADEDRRLIDNPRISVLRNIPYAEQYDENPVLPEPENPDCKVVLMVASMTHRVNVEGVTTFLRECWPLIRAEEPRAVFKIIGAGMTPTQIAGWSQLDGVQPLGFVSELAPHYEGAALAIVPLFEGGGTKIKVLEALRFRRLAVVTRHAHRGYETTLPADRTVVVADSPAELTEKILDQLARTEERQARALAGWHLVHAHYSWAAFRTAVANGVRQAVAAAPDGVRRS